MMSLLRYPIADTHQVVEFAPAVLQRFDEFRQRKFWHPEAGGQLFARIVGEVIVVGIATGPRPTDRRTPISYCPDKKEEQKEIEHYFGLGWDYAGDWHTHPQHVPEPSGVDLRTVKSTVLRSTLNFAGLLVVIAGRREFPSGLYVGLCDGIALHRLKPAW